MKRITFFLMMTLTMQAFAQRQPVSNLTVFSDDGTKFFLVLNGERYNDNPETNVRIEELPNPYYDCKIVFENKSIPVISKNELELTDMDGNVTDITYRLKKDNKGRYSLKYYSSVPIQPNRPRPANCAVYQYGHPNELLVGSDGRVYESVTVQQTTSSGNMGVSMNVGGIGVSMSVPGENITTTTTTTTMTSSSGHVVPRPRPGNEPDYNAGCRQAMNARDFEDARKTISGISFDDTKLSTAGQIVEANCLNTGQIITLIKVFSFEQNKLEFAKMAYNSCVDKNNYYKVVSAFTFDASKNELNDYLQSRR